MRRRDYELYGRTCRILPFGSHSDHVVVIGAPIFGYQTIPMKIRLAIGMVLSLAAIQTVPVIELNYVGILGFSVLVLKEMIVGLTIGFMCNMCTYIV